MYGTVVQEEAENNHPVLYSLPVQQLLVYGTVVQEEAENEHPVLSSLPVQQVTVYGTVVQEKLRNEHPPLSSPPVQQVAVFQKNMVPGGQSVLQITQLADIEANKMSSGGPPAVPVIYCLPPSLCCNDRHEARGRKAWMQEGKSMKRDGKGMKQEGKGMNQEDINMKQEEKGGDG